MASVAAITAKHLPHHHPAPVGGGRCGKRDSEIFRWGKQVGQKDGFRRLKMIAACEARCGPYRPARLHSSLHDRTVQQVYRLLSLDGCFLFHFLGDSREGDLNTIVVCTFACRGIAITSDYPIRVVRHVVAVLTSGSDQACLFLRHDIPVFPKTDSLSPQIRLSVLQPLPNRFATLNVHRRLASRVHTQR